jgi:hypothetical protein
MMRRLTLVMLVCVCALVPTAARADNGGWLDWLYSLDPKLVGIGTEFHLCLDDTSTIVNCEDWFGIAHKFFGEPWVSLDKVKHEVDFRVGYYWKYGDRFSDVPDPLEENSIHAFRLMVLYHYRPPEKHLAVGFGAGFMPFFGDGFGSFSRGVLTPLSVIYAPATSGNLWKKAFIIRVESSYITQGFTGADFGNSITKYTTNGGEWNFSVATGFDFRRIH